MAAIFESLVHGAQKDFSRLGKLQTNITIGVYRIGCYISECKPGDELIVDGWRALAPKQALAASLFRLQFTKLNDHGEVVSSMMYNSFGGKLIFQSQSSAGPFSNKQESKAFMQLLGSTATVDTLRAYLHKGGGNAVDEEMRTWPAMTAEQTLERVLKEAEMKAPKEGTVGWYSQDGHWPRAPWVKKAKDLRTPPEPSLGQPNMGSLAAASSLPTQGPGKVNGGMGASIELDTPTSPTESTSHVDESPLADEAAAEQPRQGDDGPPRAREPGDGAGAVPAEGGKLRDHSAQLCLLLVALAISLCYVENLPRAVAARPNHWLKSYQAADTKAVSAGQHNDKQLQGQITAATAASAMRRRQVLENMPPPPPPASPPPRPPPPFPLPPASPPYNGSIDEELLLGDFGDPIDTSLDASPVSIPNVP
ncbi:hypothetical protein PLESTM_000686400, partial [Pleodorina starrii]